MQQERAGKELEIQQLVKRSIVSGMRQRELATKIGVSQGTINNILAGLIPSRIPTLAKFSHFYGLTTSELLVPRATRLRSRERQTAARRKIGPASEVVKIPIFFEGLGAEQPDRYVRMEMTGRRLFGVRVKGGSMEPLILEGDIVIVDPDVKPGLNEIAAVQAPDGKLRVQQIRRQGRGKVVLHPLNHKYPDVVLDRTYRLLGKVLRRYRDFP